MEAWLERIQQIAEQVAQQAGCELYDLEVVGTGAGRVLRVFIDKAETGIDIEDCSTVSRGLNEILDQEDIVPGGEYNLEVSSPGLDRRLKNENHFKKVIGQKVAIQLSQNLGSLGAQDQSIQSMKKFENELLSAENGQIEFNFKNEKMKIPLSAVEKAKLVFEFKTNKPSGKGGHQQRSK